jgi:hypothetical protein
MCVTASGASCDPTRLTDWPRQSTIKGHPALCDDKRAPCDNPLVKRFVDLCAVSRQNAFSYVDAGISQLHDALAGVTRIHVDRAYNNISDTSFEYCIGACASASLRGTRFERNVERGTRGNRRCETAEAFNLSVIATGSSMMSLGYDSIVDNEESSDSGVGTSLTERLLCLVERRAHELFVSFSIHLFETSIVVVAHRGNASRPGATFNRLTMNTSRLPACCTKEGALFSRPRRFCLLRQGYGGPRETAAPCLPFAALT